MAIQMEPDSGKLFVGGISWDTDEDRLREYFGGYGEVVEAVIMRDRLTGRARGFGFVVFADPVVAQRVVMEKHMIDGRTVEAKKAVPRDDHHGGLSRNSGPVQGSPGPGSRTKKIFVGGLASTVTDSDFKQYFEQFGPITDVVVMYDHNTQRPRGFGFITFDSEEAVDRVLHKTFHELNGKMVEVKHAVPKESSPGPSRSPLVGYNYGLGRPNPNAFLAGSYPQGYGLGSMGGYGVRMDSRFSPTASTRMGFSPFGSPSYGVGGLNLEPALSPGAFGGTSNFSNNMGYGRVLGPYFGGNSNRYSTPIGFNQGNSRNESYLGSSARNVWGNGGLTSPAGPGTFLGSGSGSFGVFGTNGATWGSSVPSGHNNGNRGGFRGGETNYGLGGGGVGRNNGPGVATPSPFSGPSGGYEGLYRGGSMYGDAAWQSSANELDGPGPFGYGLDNAEEIVGRSSEGYAGNYSNPNRQPNRGIAT